MPEKADDAAGLSPSKEDNAFWRNSDRKEGEVFIKRLYQTSPNNSAKSQTVEKPQFCVRQNWGFEHILAQI